jgi:hypothetical protein
MMETQFHVEVFWIVTTCSVVVGYQCFGGLCCLHFQDEVLTLKMEAAKSSETAITYHNTDVTTQKNLQMEAQIPPKLSYRTTSLYFVTNQKNLKVREVRRSPLTVVSDHTTARSNNPEDPENGGNMVLRIAGILLHHYTVSQPRST